MILTQPSKCCIYRKNSSDLSLKFLKHIYNLNSLQNSWGTGSCGRMKTFLASQCLNPGRLFPSMVSYSFSSKQTFIPNRSLTIQDAAGIKFTLATSNIYRNGLLVELSWPNEPTSCGNVKRQPWPSLSNVSIGSLLLLILKPVLILSVDFQRTKRTSWREMT